MFTKFLTKRSAVVAVSTMLAVSPLSEAVAFPSAGASPAVLNGGTALDKTDIAFRGRGFGGHRFGGRGFGGHRFGGRGFGGHRFGGHRFSGRRFGFHRGFRGRGFRRFGYGGYGYGYGGYGVGAGLAAGALIGGALATGAAAASTAGNSVAYCESRFKSYDPASGTYLGYDGRRHPCP